MKDPVENPAERSPSVPWASLRYRDFSLLFIGSFFITTAQQMRQTQNLYQVYELSGSAFLLGMTGLAQAVPLFVVGLFGGSLADLMDRRTLSCLTMLGNFLVAVSLGVLTLAGLIQVWHILVATALTSALNIILYPARMAMISALVPRSHLTNAAALNSSVAQGAHFIGPMFAGVALAAASAGNAYLLNALAYAPAAAAFLMIKSSAESDRVKAALSLRGLLDGVRFLWLQRFVFALVIMDFVIMSIGYYRPLLPVFAKDIFHVGPAGFGMLASAPAIGGTLGTIAVLIMGDVRRKGILALWAFLMFSLCLGVFALTRSFWVALVLVAGLGLTNSLQAVMRQTSFHLLTPDHLRGRAFSVFNMFSQGANAVGAMVVGFLAALVGAPGALLTGSGVGVALTLLTWALWPEVKKFQAAPAIDKIIVA
ncbi:MAG TPA: MFS transporter [Verrucomicrobiae bacterium]|nr:MFS transporter [Verrucomicrobiae bacterium]